MGNPKSGGKSQKAKRVPKKSKARARKRGKSQSKSQGFNFIYTSAPLCAEMPSKIKENITIESRVKTSATVICVIREILTVRTFLLP